MGQGSGLEPRRSARQMPVRSAVISVLLIAASGGAIAADKARNTPMPIPAGDSAPQAPGHAGATVIYRSLMPDGRLVLSDRPAPGASQVEASAYAAANAVTPSAARAAQEREYWRAQSEAFAERHREREMALEARRAHQAELAARTAAMQEPALYGGYPIFYRTARFGAPGFAGVPTQYTSSPGAAQNRSGGFIGSGFATSSRN